MKNHYHNYDPEPIESNKQRRIKFNVYNRRKIKQSTTKPNYDKPSSK